MFFNFGKIFIYHSVIIKNTYKIHTLYVIDKSRYQLSTSLVTSLQKYKFICLFVNICITILISYSKYLTSSLNYCSFQHTKYYIVISHFDHI